jgi:hypothetical protein
MDRLSAALMLEQHLAAGESAVPCNWSTITPFGGISLNAP